MRLGRMALQMSIEQKLNMFHQNIKPKNSLQCYPEESMAMAWLIDDLNLKDKLGQQYTYQKGLKQFSKKGETGIEKEIGQLHDHMWFTPIHIKDMNPNGRRNAQLALAYLTEKSNIDIKGRVVFNRKPTRAYLEKEDSSSPTASMESIFLTGIVDAHEK